MGVFNVNEDAGSVDVCMDLTGLPMDGLECDLIVPLILVDGKAGDLCVFLCSCIVRCIFSAAPWEE